MADWRFFVPLWKPDEELIKGERKRLIHGIASTESKDKHGEELVIAGMDFDNYLKDGRLNYDHLKGPQHILGKPIDAKIIQDAGKYKKGLQGPAFYNVCEIYDTEPGKAAWDLLLAEKDDENRSHGFSVEGAVVETRGNKLTKTRVNDMALTPKPANMDTFAEFLAKSLNTANAPALVMQNLDDNMSPVNADISKINLRNVIWGNCKHKCFDANGRFKGGAKGAYLHLVGCHNADEDEAIQFVKNLANSGIF